MSSDIFAYIVGCCKKDNTCSELRKMFYGYNVVYCGVYCDAKKHETLFLFTVHAAGRKTKICFAIRITIGDKKILNSYLQ